MNWFNGSIPDAIEEVKSRQKILLVFVVGEDELSTKMAVTYDDPSVAEKLQSKNCVALKLVVNSVPYQQFSQIYPIVVIPSSFFIGKNGLPIEIITGHLEPQAFIEKIDKIFQLNDESNGPKTDTDSEACSSSQSRSGSQDGVEPMDSAASEPGIASAESSKGEHVVSSSEATLKAEPDSSQASSSSEPPLDDKVERAKTMLETRRQNKALEDKEDSDSSEGESSSLSTSESGSKRMRLMEAEEAAKEKEEEIKRREVGKALQQAKQTREEAEMKQWAESRAKEKEEERLARERVRAQIAQDRAERAARYQQVKADDAAAVKEQQMARHKEEQEKADKEAAMRSTMARLQFRLPDGSSFTNQFSADSKLEEARDYIINTIRPSFSDFNLCTTFPRRQFTASDYSQTLRDLQLAPSAAILVLPGTSQMVAISNGGGSYFSYIFWMLVSPLLDMWRAIMSVFRRDSPQENEAQQEPTAAPEPGPSGIQGTPAPSQSSSKKSTDGPEQGGVRRRDPQRVYKEGNIFRINNRPTDDDDNNTWNGNSTQQM